MIDFYGSLADRYPLVSIEDGLDENAWDGLAGADRAARRPLQLVGDDLFVTNVEFLRRGIAEGVGNAILVKVNQIGTLTETLDTIEVAQRGRLRDGHLASLGRDRGHHDRRPRGRDERGPDQDRRPVAHRPVAKYNQLLRIEEELGERGRVPGLGRLSRPAQLSAASRLARSPALRVATIASLTLTARRRTKIVATIGPASSGDEVFARLIEAGMDGARLNFSHGTHDDHGASARLVRDAQASSGRPLALIADLQGPKLRIGDLAEPRRARGRRRGRRRRRGRGTRRRSAGRARRARLGAQGRSTTS